MFDFKFNKHNSFYLLQVVGRGSEKLNYSIYRFNDEIFILITSLLKLSFMLSML